MDIKSVNSSDSTVIVSNKSRIQGQSASGLLSAPRSHDSNNNTTATSSAMLDGAAHDRDNKSSDINEQIARELLILQKHRNWTDAEVQQFLMAMLDKFLLQMRRTTTTTSQAVASTSAPASGVNDSSIVNGTVPSEKPHQTSEQQPNSAEQEQSSIVEDHLNDGPRLELAAPDETKLPPPSPPQPSLLSAAAVDQCNTTTPVQVVSAVVVASQQPIQDHKTLVLEGTIVDSVGRDKLPTERKVDGLAASDAGSSSVGAQEEEDYSEKLMAARAARWRRNLEYYKQLQLEEGNKGTTPEGLAVQSASERNKYTPNDSVTTDATVVSWGAEHEHKPGATESFGASDNDSDESGSLQAGSGKRFMPYAACPVEKRVPQMSSIKGDDVALNPTISGEEITCQSFKGQHDQPCSKEGKLKDCA